MLKPDFKIKQQDLHNLFLVFTMMVLIFFRSFNYYIGIDGANSIITTLLKFIIRFNYASLFISWFIIVYKKKIKIDVIILLLFLLISYFSTYFFYPENRIFLSDITISFVYIITVYAIVRSGLISLDTISKWGIRISVVLTLWILLINSLHLNSVLYMDLSDALSVPTFFLIYSGFVKKKRMNATISIISLIHIMVLGARGALFSILFFVLMLYKSHKISIKKILISIPVSFLMFINFIMYKNIVTIAIDIVESIGLDSRTLYKLLNSEILISTSRGEIYIYLVDLVKQNWVKGVGLAGDRYYLPFMFEGTRASYAHNIFLEILLNYGVIVGGMIIAWFMYLVLKYYLLSSDMTYENKAILSIFFAASFIQLLVSRSYLTEINLFVFLALLMNQKERIRSKNINWNRCSKNE